MVQGKSESVTTAEQSVCQAVDSAPDDAAENMQNSTPISPREIGQLRQLVRSLVCVHPQRDLIIKLLRDDGYVEYCPHCMRVTDIFEH